MEKRNSILHSALELLLAEGLKGVTHRQVAAAANVPVGSIGYYYSTREKLVATCFEHLTEARRAVFQRVTNGSVDLKDPVEFSESVVDVIACGRTDRAKEVMSAFVDAQREGGEVSDYVEGTLRELRAMVDDMLKRAGVDTLPSSRVVQIVIGAAVSDSNQNAPVVAVADLLRMAEK